MFLIECPWCGPRDETEFTYGGEAHITRPSRPSDLVDDEWANYLFYRSNTKGKHLEQWCHTSGCRQWFNTQRDTITNEFKQSYHIGDPAPESEA
jgi:heterotetrameric sarcosine oxidase delta subunit